MSQAENNVSASVRAGLLGYFADLGGDEPSNVYNMLLEVEEKPMLEVVMDQAQNNQSKAAQWLGLNRNTLRKKLLQYGLAE